MLLQQNYVGPQPRKRFSYDNNSDILAGPLLVAALVDMHSLLSHLPQPALSGFLYGSGSSPNPGEARNTREGLCCDLNATPCMDGAEQPTSECTTLPPLTDSPEAARCSKNEAIMLVFYQNLAENKQLTNNHHRCYHRRTKNCPDTPVLGAATNRFEAQ